MIDFDLLVRLGWTALLGWNLRETVANGKKIVRLETIVENGLTSKVDELKHDIEAHIDGEERRILQAVKREPSSRTRRTDRPGFTAED